MYLNSALVYWFSKKQSSVESSTFVSEFTAIKQSCEYIRGLRYKLRMMGITCEDPAYIEGDKTVSASQHDYPRLHFEEESSKYCLPFGKGKDLKR